MESAPSQIKHLALEVIDICFVMNERFDYFSLPSACSVEQYVVGLRTKNTIIYRVYRMIVVKSNVDMPLCSYSIFTVSIIWVTN